MLARFSVEFRLTSSCFLLGLSSIYRFLFPFTSLLRIVLVGEAFVGKVKCYERIIDRFQVSVKWAACGTCYAKHKALGCVVLKALKLDFPRSNAENQKSKVAWESNRYSW